MAGSTPEQIELLLRIFADTRPEGVVDAVYPFAQTESNQESVFVAARDLIETGKVRKVLISDCTAKSGYIGAVACRAAMVATGIPGGVIEEVPMEPTEILHTGIEADRTVRFARSQNYQRLRIVSAPFHQERAFISVVTAVLRQDPSLKVYSHPGEPQPWDEIATHSQGKLRGTRTELIAEELQRIDLYTRQGFLLPRSAILEYLRRRDRE